MSGPDISVVVPVSKRTDDLRGIVALLEGGVGATGKTFEVLLVIDGQIPRTLQEATAIARGDERVRVLAFAKMFGEGAALRAGLQASAAPILLTHPAYYQVEAAVIPKLIEALDEADIAFAARMRGPTSPLNRLQRWGFNALVRRGLHVEFKDVACGVRALRRDALENVSAHGSFHRFLPVLGAMKGLVVREIPAEEHPKSRRTRVYAPGIYVRRFLDVLNVYFLTKFLYKPLRFFGLIGSALFLAGLAICLWLSYERIFDEKALSDRPMLLLGVLLLALGFQTLALGLLGELITFSQATRDKGYRIREVLRSDVLRTSTARATQVKAGGYED